MNVINGYDLPIDIWGSDYAESTDNENSIPAIDMRMLKYHVPARALDHISCPICKLPFIDPYSTICGHTFCRDCLFESFKSVLGEKCPLDRVKLKINMNDLNSNNNNNSDDNIEEIGSSSNNEEYDVYPAPIILSNMTDDLIVSCINEDRGCDWTGERWSVKKHVVDSCRFTNIKCICNEMCERGILLNFGLLNLSESGIFIKSDKSSNLDKCPHTSIKCDLCSLDIMGLNLDNHLNNECLKNEIKCTGCHLTFPKMYLDQHTKHCLKLFIDCPGSKYGCKWKGQKEILDEIHLNDCIFTKLSKYFDKMEDEISKLRKENDGLKLQMSSMLDSVVQGKVYNLGYPLELEEIRAGVNENHHNNDHDSHRENDNGNTGLSISMPRVRSLIKELGVNQRITDALVHENVDLRAQLNNQRDAIVNLQQTMQFMMIDRRRMMINSTSDNAKIGTKL